MSRPCFDDGGMYAPDDLIDEPIFSLSKSVSTISKSNNSNCDCAERYARLESEFYTFRHEMLGKLTEMEASFERRLNEAIKHAKTHSNKDNDVDQRISDLMMESLKTEESYNHSSGSLSSNIAQALMVTSQVGPCLTPSALARLTMLLNPSGGPVSQTNLINLAVKILADHGPIPVGKMGSLLHKAANDQTLPTYLKEKFGGLKKFLQAHYEYFVLAEDHPYNPHVALVGQAIPHPLSGGLVDSMAMLKTVDITHHADNKVDRFTPAISEQYLPRPTTISVAQGNYVSLAFSTVGCGIDGSRNALARVSVTSHAGKVLYDEFILPTEIVSEYRCGIRPGDLDPLRAIPLDTVRRHLDHLLEGKTVVLFSGGLNLVKALDLERHSSRIRDVTHCSLLTVKSPRGVSTLRDLVRDVLHWDISDMDSIGEARALGELYRSVQDEIQFQSNSVSFC